MKTKEASMKSASSGDHAGGTAVSDRVRLPILDEPGSVQPVAPKRGKQPMGVVRIEIPELELDVFHLRLVGDTTLISHKWSEKAKSEMRDKQAKKPKQAKGKRD